MSRDLQLLANVVEEHIMSAEAESGASAGDWAIRSILAHMWETPQGLDDSLWKRAYDTIAQNYATETRDFQEEKEKK